MRASAFPPSPATVGAGASDETGPSAPERVALLRGEEEEELAGASAPAGSIVTNQLFPVKGAERKWLGKRFDRRGDVGTNRFRRGDDDEALGRDFSWSISKSRRDGEEALVLNYAAAPTPDRLFGTVLRMRDELRELEPGVLLGIGSMAATGGLRNGAPFILRRRSGGDDASSEDAVEARDDVLVDDAAD